MNKEIQNLYTLFDAAFEENINGRGTDITRMITTFVPDAIQKLQAYDANESISNCCSICSSDYNQEIVVDVIRYHTSGSCRREMVEEIKFCPSCGRKLGG